MRFELDKRAVVLRWWSRVEVGNWFDAGIRDGAGAGVYTCSRNSECLLHLVSVMLISSVLMLYKHHQRMRRSFKAWSQPFLRRPWTNSRISQYTGKSDQWKDTDCTGLDCIKVIIPRDVSMMVDWSQYTMTAHSVMGYSLLGTPGLSIYWHKCPLPASQWAS